MCRPVARGLIFLLFFVSSKLAAQNFTPIPVTGFNQDCIAEGGPSSLATTTREMDAVASNKVMYTDAFRIFAGMTVGGLPDNGTLVNANMTFQLANYSAGNALFVFRNETRSLVLAAPSTYSKLRVLCFSTEANVIGGSLVNISLSFTDGTTVPYLTNYNLEDWFNGTTNQVITGFGRCSRVAAAPWGQDGLPSNPRMYYIEITLSCSDAQKQLQRLNFSNVTTAGSNAPFPNQVFMAVSGVSYSINVVPTSTASDCTGPNGTASVTITGSAAPYTYSWNTNPVQTTATATGLLPGTYICTITDANGCITTQSVVVGLNNNQTIIASANPATICPGGSSLLTTSVVIGTPIGSAVWTPGNYPVSFVNVFPTTTTTYTVNIISTMGCIASAQVTVTVGGAPPAPMVSPVTICPGTTATLSVVNPVAGDIYNWYTASTGGVLIFSGTTYTTPVLTAPATYYVDVVTATGCLSLVRTPVTVSLFPEPIPPSPQNATVCSGFNTAIFITNPQPGLTYEWYDASTGGNLVNTGLFNIINISAPVIYYLQARNSNGCTSLTRSTFTVILHTKLPPPVVTVTNIDFNSLSFAWSPITGATGYEVSTNNGVSYQFPSSGLLGTTHTINGLQPAQTISILVRALGQPGCRNSDTSVTVKATTLYYKEIFVPNVFTPNRDGRNDELLVYGNFISAIQFRVFNQWGQLVFGSNDKRIGWDGSYKGILQPIGVYAYTLIATMNDGRVIKKQGSINLVR